jgi:dTDP-4-amino-4,6-dideoxygalactose transaminase
MNKITSKITKIKSVELKMIEVWSPSITRKEMDAVLTVLVEEKIGPGEQAQRLIQFAKEALHFDYCLALRSPVTALAHSISLLQPEKGSGIAVSALSPAYYHKVINNLGLKTVVFDTLPCSPFSNASIIAEACQRARPESPVAGIVLHHSLGYMPKMEEICEIGLPLIEDCSQAVGAGFGVASGETEDVVLQTLAGTFGTFTILGLEERDMLTSGGGALLFAAQKRNSAVLRNSGEFEPESGLADMNAAMAIVQFREAKKNDAKRKEYAEIYIRSALQQGKHKLFVQSDNFVYNNYAFPLVLETGMKEVSAWAKRKEIVVENAFSNTLIGKELVSQDLCRNAYSLSLRTALFPIYPRLGTANAVKVGKLIQTLP